MKTMELMPEVIQAVAVDGYYVYAYLNDGTVHRFDVWPLIRRGGVFKPLENMQLLKDTLTTINGTVAWDLEGNRNPEKCIDIDPFAIKDSPIVADPIANF